MNIFFYDTKEYKAGSIPVEAIADCSRGGQDALASVTHWVKELGFDFPPAWAIPYLLPFGAWSEKELQNHEENKLKIFWLICCDLSETNDFIGLLH